METTSSQSYHPKVSIGLAVFNGERFLREAIESILQQTFTDFELIISDNASTDQTEEICREYATKDRRICYHRNEINLGWIENSNITFRMAKGQYFQLAGHDDIMEPTLIEKSVEVLDRNPSIVLCYSKVSVIDENNKNLYVVEKSLATSDRVCNRVLELSKPHDAEAIYSLIRSRILSRTSLLPNYPEPDLSFLFRVGLYGQFYRIPEILFNRRTHPKQSSRSNLYEKANCEISTHSCHVKSTPSVIDLFLFLIRYHWLQLSYFYRVISNAPLTFGERIKCSFYVINWLFQRFTNKSRELYYAYFKSEVVSVAVSVPLSRE